MKLNFFKSRRSHSKRQQQRKQKFRDVAGAFRHILSSRTLSKKFFYGFLLSTTYFVFTFIIVYVIYQLTTILLANLFELPVVWYFNELKFPLPPGSPLYTRSALIIVFGVGPLISLMMAFFFLRIYYSKNAFLRSVRMFSVWGIINSLNMVFGSYIVGCLTRTDFIYTTEWIMLNNPFDVRELIFTTLSMLIMLIIGWQLTSMFLVSSGSRTLVSYQFRPFFVVTQIVLPWIAGGILLFFLTTPRYHTPFELKTMTPGLMLIPSLFTYNSVQNDTSIAMGIVKRKRFNWSIVIVAMVVLFFLRFLLNFGLRMND